MENFARKTVHKGAQAVELCAGGYYAVVAHGLGSNVLRFRDEKRKMEIFRYSPSVSMGEIMNAPEIWGLPTLYLPNRFENGLIRTSDALYRLPVNETRFGNHLHGFIQKRAYQVRDMGAANGKAFVLNEFAYDENDFFFNVFPLKFTVQVKVELSSKGLSHTVTLTNQSDKMMPVSIATHTTINAPFTDGGSQENIRLRVPISEKIIFNKSKWLPTGKRAKLSAYDQKYIDGICPVLTDICNDMYSGSSLDLNGKPFHGTVMTDTLTGCSVCNEVDDKYKFWIIWNDRGFNGYFCPEPMTAQVNAPNLDIPPELSGYEELAPGCSYCASQRFFTIG